MAQQAILAAAERRRQVAAEAGGFMRRVRRQHHPELRVALAASADRLGELFTIWDADQDGTIDRKEFRRALKLMGMRVTTDDFNAFCAMCDTDNSGTLDLEEIRTLLESVDDGGQEQKRPAALPVRLALGAYSLLQSTAMQAVLYVAVVAVFQMLADSLRLKSEILLSERLSRSFLNNDFDWQHNQFADIRRISDVYEWGNTVFIPSLFGDADTLCTTVGPPYHFMPWSADASAGYANGSSGTGLPPHRVGCNDHAWSDGAAPYDAGGTALTVGEVVMQMNQFDWSDGILIRQSRVQATAECPSLDVLGGVCQPQLSHSYGAESYAPFGYNWTVPTAPLQKPFRWWSAADLGTDPLGGLSAHQSSYLRLPPGGFVAAIVPFFSDALLPDERGTADSVTDYRLHSIRTTNRTASYFCVRLSWNGEQLVQLCDPNLVVDGVPRTTGRVRAAIEEMWNDLRRAHYLDTQSRSLVITTQIGANSLGVKMRAEFIFEFTAAGGVAASYDTISRVVDRDKVASTAQLLPISFGFTVFFCVLEVLDMLDGGIGDYFCNVCFAASRLLQPCL